MAHWSETTSAQARRRVTQLSCGPCPCCRGVVHPVRLVASAAGAGECESCSWDLKSPTNASRLAPPAHRRFIRQRCVRAAGMCLAPWRLRLAGARGDSM
eukprot:823773-Pyramimonas_sp.AAC.2